MEKIGVINKLSIDLNVAYKSQGFEVNMLKSKTNLYDI